MRRCCALQRGHTLEPWSERRHRGDELLRCQPAAVEIEQKKKRRTGLPHHVGAVTADAADGRTTRRDRRVLIERPVRQHKRRVLGHLRQEVRGNLFQRAREACDAAGTNPASARILDELAVVLTKPLDAVPAVLGDNVDGNRRVTNKLGPLLLLGRLLCRRLLYLRSRSAIFPFRLGE